MILQSLCALAEHERLVEQPAFQSVAVRWIIDLDEQGNFRTLTDTAYTVQEEGKRKPRQEYKRMSVPRRTVRPGQVTKPEFLVDEERNKAVADLQTRRFASSEWITFRVRGDFLHESPAVKRSAEQRHDCRVLGRRVFRTGGGSLVVEQ
jgi:hypothetical protein